MAACAIASLPGDSLSVPTVPMQILLKTESKHPQRIHPHVTHLSTVNSFAWLGVGGRRGAVLSASDSLLSSRQ